MLMSGGNSPEHLTQCPHHALFSHQNSWCHDSNPALFFLPCVTYQAENTGHQRANRESLGLSPFLSPNHPYSKWNEETDLNFHEVSQVLERQKWTKLPSASVTVGGLSGPARLVADVCLFLPSVLVCKEINLLSSIQWCDVFCKGVLFQMDIGWLVMQQIFESKNHILRKNFPCLEFLRENLSSSYDCANFPKCIVTF